MLDWGKFKSLSGPDTDNFEKLCRSIVRRRFGRYGPLYERKNQPGVEYYIHLNQDSSELGSRDDKVGWQCKWFARKANDELKANSRTQILHSLKKTDEHVSGLTRWILWTPFTLAKADQDWFYSLQSTHNYQLELWSDSDIESSLDGSALLLKGSYFGELALTPEVLEQQHRESVAPIKERWIKEVHQQVDAEKEIRQFLGESSAWNEFEHTGEFLARLGETIEQFSSRSIYADWNGELNEFAQTCAEFAAFSEFFKKSISGEDMESIYGMLEHAEGSLDVHIHYVLRQLRKRNLPLSLEITNALAFINDIKKLLHDVSKSLSLSFVAVMADAGGGKTQMAAEITAPQSDRPAGILLHGRQLRRGLTLDDLAQRVSFYGQNLPNFAALLAALDAAACRDNCRLPIVIDGLNEAEDPREWKSLLATVLEQLHDYPNVLLVCTLRTGERARVIHGFRSNNNSNSRETFAQMALPENCIHLECNGFSDATKDAVICYFHHYKIEADLSQIPEDFFNHPLNLRIFCDATNRHAKHVVKVDRFPSSITTLFHSQIEYAAQRISEMPNLETPYRPTDVRKAIYHLGLLLWESGQRHISEEQFLFSAGQQGRVWDENIVNLLSQEGILFRDPGDEPYSYVLTPIYDRLGGYVIADALLKRNQNDVDGNWVNDPPCIDMLFGNRGISHQLSQDIVHALVALLPKRLSKQFWEIVPDDYRDNILEISTLIDADDFCAETEDEYRQLLLSCKIESSTFLRLKRVRSSGRHPLNADFLNSVLKTLTMADRDLSWTEFIRMHHDDVLKEIQRFEEHWKSDCLSRSEGDRLKARWISWVLTSTCMDLRDYATRALYWYGRGAVDKLYEMTIESLEINDPYVSERLLAASYGVAMFFTCKEVLQPDVELFTKKLCERMFDKSASHPTTHILARDYASKLVELVNESSPQNANREQLVNSTFPFPSMPRLRWEVKEQKSRSVGAESPFRMDFENYTIGRLVPERGNYDYDQPIYQEVRAKILWRIEELGWSSEKFSEIEKSIDANASHYYGRQGHAKTQRYGKKYSWIAYYEMAGQLLDEGKLQNEEGRFTVDIDPNFPEPTEEKPDDSTYYLAVTNVNTAQWITNSPLPDLGAFTTVETIDDVSGGWVLLNGHIVEESQSLDRSFYADVKAFLLDIGSSEKLRSSYENLEQGSVSRPSMEQTYYLYAGELYQNYLYSLVSDAKFEITVGSEIKKIEKPDIKYIKNDDGTTTISISDTKVVSTIEVPKVEYVNTHLTVAEYTFDSENSAIPGVHSTILTPMLFDKLNLVFDPASLEYYDSDGKLAAKNIATKGVSDSNSRSLFYIRKGLLMDLLASEDLKLVWCVSGERRLVRMEDFHSRGDDRVLYSDFSFCQFFDTVH